MTQTRHYCRECRREWVYAHQWAGSHCPACGSPEIERRTFQAVFPGADIETAAALAQAPLRDEAPRVLPFVPPNLALQASEVDPYVEQLAALLGESL